MRLNVFSAWARIATILRSAAAVQYYDWPKRIRISTSAGSYSAPMVTVLARPKPARQSFLQGVENAQVIVKGFQDGHFPYDGAEIKSFFEELKAFEPDLIFTHCRHDLHQDHRVTAELTWNTFRDHFILEYEIPKYDGDLQSPNFFIHLPASIRQQKIDLLMKYFATQNNRHWFTPDTFNAIMRIRGVESRAPELYAEGFYSRKVVM